MNQYLGALDNSSWLQHIKAVLDAAIFIARVSDKCEQTSVSDAQTRTSRMTVRSASCVVEALINMALPLIADTFLMNTSSANVNAPPSVFFQVLIISFS